MGEHDRLAANLDLQGHRGARGLAPENTWPAFQKALEYRMNTLELDTVITNDNHQLVHHDTDLNPLLCQKDDGGVVTKQKINSLTLDFLQSLDCGILKNEKFPEQSPVPGTRLLTLPEFFEKFKEYEQSNAWARGVHFNIEAKFAGDTQASEEEIIKFADIMANNVKKSGYEERVTVQSFVIGFLPVIKEKLPSSKTSALFAPTQFTGLKMYLGFGATERVDVLRRAKAAGADIISPYFLYSTADFNRMAHAKGMLVIPWTVNEKDEMLRQIKAGVDGLISDYPNRLREVTESR